MRERIARAHSPPHACELISQLFGELLADRDWLPPSYQEQAAGGGMGDGIGQWLVFRAADRSLSLSSLVVPPGAMTPVHDHLPWGLVGVYRGSQDEEFYRPGDGRLVLVRRRPLDPGDFTRCCGRHTQPVSRGRAGFSPSRFVSAEASHATTVARPRIAPPAVGRVTRAGERAKPSSPM